MEPREPSFRNAEFPLPEEAQRRLDQFKAFSLRHPLLDEVETQLLHAIWEPAGFAYVIVFGPSGVGKSTMIEILVNHFNAARALSFGSLLLTEARPPEGELFDRTDYYHTTFKKLGIKMAPGAGDGTTLLVIQAISKKSILRLTSISRLEKATWKIGTGAPPRIAVHQSADFPPFARFTSCIPLAFPPPAPVGSTPAVSTPQLRAVICEEVSSMATVSRTLRCASPPHRCCA